MKIIKDNRQWLVNVTFHNLDCPHLYYPANIHGCKLLEQIKGSCNANGVDCNMDNCPRLVLLDTDEKD